MARSWSRDAGIRQMSANGAGIEWMKSDVWLPLLESARGGYLPLAPVVSTVRYPIPQRTLKYVATVQR